MNKQKAFHHQSSSPLSSPFQLRVKPASSGASPMKPSDAPPEPPCTQPRPDRQSSLHAGNPSSPISISSDSEPTAPPPRSNRRSGARLRRRALADVASGTKRAPPPRRSSGRTGARLTRPRVPVDVISLTPPPNPASPLPRATSEASSTRPCDADDSIISLTSDTESEKPRASGVIDRITSEVSYSTGCNPQSVRPGSLPYRNTRCALLWDA